MVPSPPPSNRSDSLCVNFLIMCCLVSVFSFGCRRQDRAPTDIRQTQSSVQFFNEALLGADPTQPIPVLLPSETAKWVPKQVVIDYDKNACVGAIIHYEREYSFEELRDALNLRFSSYEDTAFAKDPKMGIWRVENSGFTIQLSDNEEEDSYIAIYIRFADSSIVSERLEELYESDPELFEGFTVDGVE